MDKLTDIQVQQYLENLDGWEYAGGAIETSFEFKNFKETFTIMTRIALECESQGHHPDWSNNYNILNIRLYTHEADGVTEKDFKLAHSIEEIIDTGHS